MKKTPITTFRDWFATESNAAKTLTDSNIQEINEKIEQLLSVEKELLEEFHREGISFVKYGKKWGNVSTDDIYDEIFKIE
jgi:predicted  nucleic acid-binding Zn-ribbon protein